MARSRGTWTREKALEMARKGNLIRWSRPRPEPVPPATAALESPAQSPAPGFADLSLSRTRAHIHNLHQVLSVELCRNRPDAQQVNWLCKSLAELAELERRLAGRPMPGSLRPSAPAPQPAARPPAIPSGPSRPPAPPDTESPAPAEQPARLTLTPPPEW